MALTIAQQTTVKADILATPELNVLPNNSDGAFAIAALYNLEAVPSFVAWRTDIPTKDVKTAVVWTEYIGRSVGERAAFELIISNGIVNAADTNIRQGFQDIFSGPNGATTRANLVSVAKRNTSRIEKLLATGTGTDASPATMTFEGSISFQDIELARNS